MYLVFVRVKYPIDANIVKKMIKNDFEEMYLQKIISYRFNAIFSFFS